jgi:hypothetical protein
MHARKHGSRCYRIFKFSSTILAVPYRDAMRIPATEKTETKIRHGKDQITVSVERKNKRCST